MTITLEHVALGGRPTEDDSGVRLEDQITTLCVIGDDSPTLFSPGTLLLTLRRDEESDEEHTLAVSLHGPRGVGKLCVAQITFAPASAGPRDALRHRTMLRFPEPFGFSLPGDYVFRTSIDGRDVGELSVPATTADGILRAVFNGLWEDPSDETPADAPTADRRLRAELPFTLYCGDAFAGYRVARLWLPAGAELGCAPFEIELWPPSPRLAAAPEFAAAVRAAHDRYLGGPDAAEALGDGRAQIVLYGSRVEQTFSLCDATASAAR